MSGFGGPMDGPFQGQSLSSMSQQVYEIIYDFFPLC